MAVVGDYIILQSKTKGRQRFEVFQSIDIDRNLDNIISTMAFSVPSDSTIGQTISKYDYIEYYVRAPDSSSQSYRCKFRGYVDTISKTVSKTDREVSITCLDKLSLMDRIDMTVKFSMTTLNELIAALMGEATIAIARAAQTDPFIELTFGLFNYRIDLSSSEIILQDLEESTNLIEYFKNIREKNTLYIYYEPESDLIIVTAPTFLQYDYSSSNYIEVYQFDTHKNLLGTLDYGEISNDINEVHVVGLTETGIARDSINQTIQGVSKIERHYNYSGAGLIDLENQAKEILLDRMRNFKLTARIPFINKGLDINLGNYITIIDHDKLDGSQLYLVRSIQYTVSKDDVIITIAASASSIVDVPEKYVIENFGVASTRLDTVSVKSEKPEGYGE